MLNIIGKNKGIILTVLYLSIVSLSIVIPNS